MNNLVELAEACNVSIKNKKIFENMKQYLAIAIPSFFFVISDWAAHDLLTIISGLVGPIAATALSIDM